jgi:hypothetical protein
MLAFLNKKGRRHTLPGVTPVPSALMGLTALFGMGRGDPHRYNHPKLLRDPRSVPKYLNIISRSKEVIKRRFEEVYG